MKSMKFLITCFIAFGMLLVGYFAVCDFYYTDYVSGVFFSCFFVLFGYMIYDLWFERPKMKQQEKRFKQKCQAVDFVVKHKRGTREAFCQIYGEDVYNSFLDCGYIHELLDCAPDDVVWEATRRANITLQNLKKDYTENFL